MAIHNLSAWQHNHVYDPGNLAGERRTWIVVGITAVTMVAEIVAGALTGSMALLADGWHMATHVVALSIAGVAYLLARRWARDERFAFGTWKIEVLGAFSSALLLGVVGIVVVFESVQRLMEPAPISFVPALVVAVIGLAVNLAFALVYNTLGVPVAAGVLYPFTGTLLSPMIAAVAMSFSSVSVVTNALRLRRA